MKTKNLYLIRHGKAEGHSFTKPDYERNLTEKGSEDAKQVASALTLHLDKTAHIAILSSPANRAAQTAELFCEAIGHPTSAIMYDRSIYEAYYSDILDAINKVPSDVETLLVFGHNPGLSNLANYLTHTLVDLNTSEVAVIELQSGFDFSDLSGGTATLKEVIG